MSTTLAAAPTVDGGGPTTAAATPRRGDSLGRYLVLELLGRGGMGVVVSAYDPELDRRVAVKVLGSAGVAHDDERQRRLVREAQAMARLSHANVVPVFDAGTVDGTVFVAMELCRGGTLTRWLRAEERPWRQVIEAFLAAGRGLTAAHDAGMIHRDFKPDNVLLTDDGTFKVSDFGLVAVAGQEAAPGERLAGAVAEVPELTRTGAVLGTPRYMAPEQWSGGTVDARTDQFSFCAALYEALWPTLVPATATFAALSAAEQLPAPSKDDPVPAVVHAAIARGLAMAPEDRHTSIAGLAAAMPLAPPPRRRRALVVAVGGATAAAAVALALAGRPGPSACGLPPADLDGVWTDDARARLRAGFVATGASFADKTADHAAASLDAYARAWSLASRDACRAARAVGERGAILTQRRLGCLERRRDSAGALIRELIERPDTAALSAAPAALASLPAITDCADGDLLARRPTPAPANAALVDDTTRALAAVDAQLAAGHADAAAAALPAIEHRAQRLDYSPLWIEVLLARAEVRGTRGQLDDARTDLYSAAALARRDGLDDLEAATWRLLANGERFGDDHLSAAAAAQQAGAIAHRRDDRRGVVEAMLLEIRALAERGLAAEARARLAQVAPRVREFTVDDWRLAARWAMARSAVATATGAHAEAAEADGEAYRWYVEHLGADHPELAFLEARLAIDASQLGDLDEARRWLDRARDRTQNADVRDLLPAMIAVNGAALATRSGADPTRDVERARALLAGSPPTSLIAAGFAIVDGAAAFRAGDLRTAQARFADALARLRGQKVAMAALAAENLAMTQTLLGELEAAEATARDALALRGQDGADPVLAALARGTLARIISARGRHAEAEVLFERALSDLELRGSPRAPAIAELIVAHAVNLEQLDRAAEAAALVEPTLPVLEAAGNDYYLGLALMFAADHRWRTGDRVGAHDAARAARVVLTREGDSPDELAELASWVRAHPLR